MDASGDLYIQFLRWTGIFSSIFFDSKGCHGKVNEHNYWIPKDFWLEEWEKESIIQLSLTHSDEGYRRLAFMVLDQDAVAVSPISV